MKRSEWEKRVRLDGRVAVVTGAAGYLGAPMCEALAAAGARVMLVDRAGESLARLQDRIRADGGLADAVELDLFDDAALVAGMRRVAELAGRLDILVNNAYAGGGGTMTTATTEEFERAYRIAVIVPARLMQEARPLLRTSAVDHPGGSSVINIGSMYGVVSPDLRVYVTESGSNPPFYGAAKAAIIHLTRYAACQLAAERIRVNCISPGPFPAPTVRQTDPEFVARLDAKVPLGRVGRAEEIAGAVVFLSSDAASYVTGANLTADGGWTAW